ncbi:hypothetical protein BCR44DRAFT_1441048, partial [Catenaria anguillulae PL171]
MISRSTPASAVARLGQVHGRRQFTLVSMASVLVMVMMCLFCFAHASSPDPARAHALDVGYQELPLTIPPTTAIKLQTSDGKVFDTTAAIVSRSSVILGSLPLMPHVLAWLDHHQGTVLPSTDPLAIGWKRPTVSDWDKEFLDSWIMTPYSLSFWRPTTSQEIADMFNIENVYPEEEEEEIRRENERHFKN